MNRLSVKYKIGVDTGSIYALETKLGLKQVKVIPPLRVYGYAVSPENMKNMKNILSSSPLVEYVEEDGQMHAL